ncbi:hypothetical protein PF010_g33009 [Phytophthora fragariae]|uniref:Uncharacterized protein n=1 Tax=Phytophthora fragariae TaxID=53985 RepID=A0A6A3V0Q2_9STRA|nr:hypothetical protein PF010_g33009 [Phytophthora fragariae]KAE9156571.1 hypothetical protein PF002_g33585 [Phytophthora fragariae]
MKRGFRARLGWCVGRCCCLFWGVFVRASAVGLVVKYLVANEMPGFDSRTAHSLCRIAFWAHSRPQHAFWRSGIASQASGRPPWTCCQAQVASTADRPPVETGSWSA